MESSNSVSANSQLAAYAPVEIVIIDAHANNAVTWVIRTYTDLYLREPPKTAFALLIKRVLTILPSSHWFERFR